MTAAPDSGGPQPQHAFRRFTTEVDPPSEFLRYLGRSSSTPSMYTPPYFDWKIAKNPFGPSGMYLRYRDGIAAAHCSIVAKPLNTDFAEGALGELGDTHTHPDFQRQGHFAAIGKHVIEDFERLGAGADTLIYGLPNANALPGWTRSIGCTTAEQLQITERQLSPLRAPLQALKRALPAIRPGRNGPVLERWERDQGPMDAIWARMDHTAWLLRKDGRWWSWRYRDATEPFETYLARDDTGAPIGWIVARFVRTRMPTVRRIIIGDICAVSEAAEVDIFRVFLTSVPRPADIVIGWFQQRTRLSDEAARAGFEETRKVPVIFASNQGYAKLAQHARWFRLSIGDTDNI